MLLSLVPSSAKQIATRILIVAKLNGRKILIWEALFVISSIPVRNYMFKTSNLNTRVRCENCSRLRMLTLTPCKWCCSSVLIVNCEHISNFVLTVDFGCNCLLGWYWKDKHFWGQDWVYHALCCSILSVNKI